MRKEEIKQLLSIVESALDNILAKRAIDKRKRECNKRRKNRST